MTSEFERRLRDAEQRAGGDQTPSVSVVWDPEQLAQGEPGDVITIVSWDQDPKTIVIGEGDNGKGTPET